jgi:2-keto-3-deoxy-L-arabinonate dehydratase
LTSPDAFAAAGSASAHAPGWTGHAKRAAGPSALLPDLIKPVVEHYRAARRAEAAAHRARILLLINYENRQCGLRAAKTVMREDGVIASNAVQHHIAPLSEAQRTEMLEIARDLSPLALHWAR